MIRKRMGGKRVLRMALEIIIGRGKTRIHEATGEYKIVRKGRWNVNKWDKVEGA